MEKSPDLAGNVGNSAGVAAIINVDLPRGAAISGTLLSGATSFQALLGAHWSVP
jgi:hypothetical protein